MLLQCLYIYDTNGHKELLHSIGYDEYKVSFDDKNYYNKFYVLYWTRWMKNYKIIFVFSTKHLITETIDPWCLLYMSVSLRAFARCIKCAAFMCVTCKQEAMKSMSGEGRVVYPNQEDERYSFIGLSVVWKRECFVVIYTAWSRRQIRALRSLII